MKSDKHPLVVPSEIPFDRLRGYDLEECLYWLLDAMGAKDLEWRVGGDGSGAPDGGRDLEAYFLIPSPEGEVTRQKWWLEAKGRSGTLERSEVQASVLNVTNRSDLDVVVIATNTRFSNPTRDWIAEWQKKHPRPMIRLWERARLEKLLSEHPTAVLRLFSKALSPQGRLEIVSHRAWNYSSFATRQQLYEIWRQRRELAFDEQALFAVVAGEFANGQVSRHRWLMEVDLDLLASTLAISLANIFYILARAEDAGVDRRPFLRAITYLTLRVLQCTSMEVLQVIFMASFSHESHEPWPESVRKMAESIILGHILAEITDACTSDCSRISVERTILSEAEVDQFWQGFRGAPDSVEDEDLDVSSRPILICEWHDKPCKVGFPVSKESHCPLINIDFDNFDYFFTVLKQVVGGRAAS